ncbi:MAG: hypothetical protein Udaeo2_25630 [Candidatus Udaeobacter sp.]|nr:MAG: hypothetical protein Udaeo2_25630 [Candidatus Udaeobacter sp.]
MRWWNRMSVTREDDVQRSLLFAPRSFNLEFDVAARRLDHQHNGRRWIFDQGIDCGTGRGRDPVDPGTLAQLAEDCGLILRQEGPPACRLGVHERGL